VLFTRRKIKGYLGPILDSSRLYIRSSKYQTAPRNCDTMAGQTINGMKRLLVFASYGMEMIECGGTLIKHVEEGWKVHVAVILCRKENRSYVEDAAALMGVTVEFLDYEIGKIGIGIEDRSKMIRVIRKFRPRSVIFYDPEHSMSDLDPERRVLSILFLESMSLCGRKNFPELGRPHSVGSIYYLSPVRANCVVDITSTFKRKIEALAKLNYQMIGTGHEFIKKRGAGAFDALGVEDPGTDFGRGMFALSEAEKGHCLHYGLGEHGTPPLVEAFRKEGLIVLRDLY
jgi:N-acetylglucosamine malate deacetylase 1